MKIIQQKFVRSCFLAVSCLALFDPGTALAASGTATNTPPRWLPLADLLKKWADTSLDGVKQAAEGGDLTAQHYLGYCYAEGLRVPADGKNALTWYQRAGEGGYLPSFSNIGLLYQRGKVVPRDYAKARHFFELAANAGYPGAEANLGFLYRDGLGVPKNAAQSMRWIRLAADQGHPGAMSELGRFYRFGTADGERNLAEASKWFEKAAAAGFTLGEYNLGLMFEEDYRDLPKAFSYYRHAAEAGDTPSMVKLSAFYSGGKNVPVDNAEAVKWLAKAGEGGSATALHQLGFHYLNGTGVGQDEARGVDLIRKAADLDDSEALVQLASLYAQDIGEPRSPQDQPLNLLLRAAAVPNRNAFWALSHRYQTGLGTERDLVEAAGWRFRAVEYELMYWGQHDHFTAQAFGKVMPADPLSGVLLLYGKAAKGDSNAFKQIGNLYLEGKNVPKNPERAKFWFSLADHSAKPAAELPPEWFEQWNQAAQAARAVVADLEH